MSEHDWVTFGVGVAVGGAAGYRFGTWWLPSLLGRIAALGIRKDIRSYRRRGRR